MSDTPPQKKKKILNQAKCVKCSDFLRKYPTAKCKKMDSREEASKFSKLYNYFTQENHTLSEKCFGLRRLQKYKSTKNSTNARDHSHMPSVTALHQSINGESIAKMDNMNESGVQLLNNIPVIDICREPNGSQQTIQDNPFSRPIHLSQNSQQSISSYTTTSVSEYQPSDTSKDFSTKINPLKEQ
ncbi:hypothetical protein CBL_20451 [Carabus blaptoides fortunei]